MYPCASYPTEEISRTPLCVFCLSPAFSIRPFTESRVVPPSRRRDAAVRRRRNNRPLPRVGPRFRRRGRPVERLLRHLASGVATCRRRRSLTIEEVLETIRLQAWRATKEFSSFSPATPEAATMEERFRKVSCGSSDPSSPVLLRRRLSAPETIMRKHMLSQQRSESQDSDGTQTSEVKSCQWRHETGTGSDPNLNKKRDSGFMRKSTLLRRLWSNNSKSLSDKSSRFPGSFYEWQSSMSKTSSGKSSYSFLSNHSSPEHAKSQSRRSLNGDELMRTSPKHHRNHQSPTQGRKASIAAANSCYGVTSTESTGNRVSSTATPKTTTTTATTTTETEYALDNSDSAYANSRSGHTQSSSRTTTVSSEVHQKIVIGLADVSNQNANKILEHQKLDVNANAKELHPIKNSETQTVNTTNINVISNVELSKATLDVIYNQVLQDVQNKIPNTISINTISASVVDETSKSSPQSKIINVQQVPSFYLKQTSEKGTVDPKRDQMLKYMISNVGTGSPYGKPAEVPQIVVPRYSAYPRTSSMEVNPSSAESTDKESDTVSLVDSLEDPSSPHTEVSKPSNNNKHDNKPVRGDLSILLPDNSDSVKPKVVNKSPAYFIPIDTNTKSDFKSVSEHLPEKVKERLARRQMKRELKMQQAKLKATSPKMESTDYSNFYRNRSNDFVITEDFNIERDINSNKPRRRSKPLFPRIQTIRKIRIDSSENAKYVESEEIKYKTGKSTKRKSSKDSFGEHSTGSRNKSYWTSKPKHKSSDRLSPIYTTKNEYSYHSVPGRIYHKTELNNSNKRIEILEIMECIEVTPSDKYAHQQSSKNKSRIPVLVQPKLPKIPQTRSEKPTFLDFQRVHISDPKIDQLIANILIDTLNNEENNTNGQSRKEQSAQKEPEIKHLPYTSQSKHSNIKYHQHFEVIPEEYLLSSTESNCNNGNISLSNENENENEIQLVADRLTEQTLKNNNICEVPMSEMASATENHNKDPYKGKAALAVVRDENLGTIPQGWITFYMLQKSQTSPESTSDEGKKHTTTTTTENSKTKPSETVEENAETSEHKLTTLENKQESEERIASNTSTPFKIANKDDNESSPSLEKLSSPSENEGSYQFPQVHPTRHRKQSSQRKSRHQTFQSRTANQHTLRGWSVTVSGTNTYGEFAPNLEMRLKFPQFNTQNAGTSDSGLGEDQSVRKTYQKQESTKHYDTSSVENDTSYADEKTCKLPNIKQVRMGNKKPKRDTATRLVKAEPRQTKTSSRRFSLNRPTQLPLLISNVSESDANVHSEGRNFEELLRRFPHLLTVTGNAIYPEQKPRVYTMSERDLVRNIFTNNQH